MTSEQGQPEITSDEVLSMSHYRQRASGVGKRCPYCAERVKREARRCRHCGQDINER